MNLISICLASNRGSYEEGKLVPGDFNYLKVETGIGSGPNLDYIDSGDRRTIQSFIDSHTDKYIIGFIGYDAGFGWMENRKPKQASVVSFPPLLLMAIDPSSIKKDESDNTSSSRPLPETLPIRLQSLINKEQYFKDVNNLKSHIQLGDIYEVNYCIPFVAENIFIDPTAIFERLNRITPMPFSALIDTQEFSIISASPERFIRKKTDRLFIQPMKGTKAREIGKEEIGKEILRNDQKERSENVMIVDLTRNDLSKLAKKGTVQVNELFGVYTFPSVLQMISTISCQIDPDEKFSNILNATFPMGSMTGAPKKRAMQLIDQYECFSRGPFSGMLGYREPSGDFDFSVLIRTIFYNKLQKKLFIGVGSAITSKSDVEKEYEECLIKLQPLLKALNANIS
jgi:para-aminobenzoate synthetase component 1